MGNRLLNIRDLTAFSILLFSLLVNAGCTESPSPVPVIPELTRDEQWVADINLFASELPGRHVNLFSKLSRQEFDHDVETLVKAVPRLDDGKIILALARIVTKVGDAHTTLSIPSSAPFHLFPFELYWFSDGLVVVGAARGYEMTLGKRITAIEGTPVGTVFDSVMCYIPHENVMWARCLSPQALIIAELLNDAGVIMDPASTSFTFEGAGTIPVSAVPFNASQSGVSVLSSLSVPVPLYLTNMNLNYWYTRIDSVRAVYCAYNRCAIMGSQTFNGFTAELLSILDSTGTDRLVLDLRGNSGGNSSIARPLIDGIKARSSIDRPGHLFVLIGRKTFSSALINSVELKNETHAIFIGEPTGGKPNAFGEVQSFVLPYSHISIQYSTKYFRYGNDNELSFAPDLMVELSSSDYLQGKDRVLDAALRYQ